VTPGDVAALTVPEFTVDLDVNRAPSLDLVCSRFVDDMNRALVWLIRFKALEAWCGRAEINDWLIGGPSHSRDACELAASFELNGQWQFDVEGFRSAIESANAHRLPPRRA
jgi:hypothetical protein